MNVREVDHVAVAVHSIPDALRLFMDALGGRFVAGGDDERLEIRTVWIKVGGFKLELMQPLRESSYLARFLERHGQGFHHLTIFVEDVERAIRELEAKGFEVVDTDLSSTRWRETFVRPRSGFGTLIQVVDTDYDRWNEPFPGITLADVLAGRVVWRDNRPQPRDEAG